MRATLECLIPRDALPERGEGHHPTPDDALYYQLRRALCTVGHLVEDPRPLQADPGVS